VCSSDLADIHIMTGELSPHDVRRLIAGSDVLLSPHRSEGFGLPLAEAFLAGVPALATGWSGNLDFMSGTPELLIDYTLVPVSDPYGVYRAPGQQWAEPDSSDAVTKLRKLANSPGLMRELAEEGRNAVLAFNRHWQRDSLLQHKIGQLTAGAPTAHSG
jgi:glycosyltransferase involved in cell wall biosynthesis